jgi:hypothetical protein
VFDAIKLSNEFISDLDPIWELDVYDYYQRNGNNYTNATALATVVQEKITVDKEAENKSKVSKGRRRVQDEEESEEEKKDYTVNEMRIRQLRQKSLADVRNEVNAQISAGNDSANIIDVRPKLTLGEVCRILARRK